MKLTKLCGKYAIYYQEQLGSGPTTTLVGRWLKFVAYDVIPQHQDHGSGRKGPKL